MAIFDELFNFTLSNKTGSVLYPFTNFQIIFTNIFSFILCKLKDIQIHVLSNVHLDKYFVRFLSTEFLNTKFFTWMHLDLFFQNIFFCNIFD